MTQLMRHRILLANFYQLTGLTHYDDHLCKIQCSHRTVPHSQPPYYSHLWTLCLPRVSYSSIQRPLYAIWTLPSLNDLIKFYINW